jgi:CRISPR-associated endonuclease Cas2
MAIKESDIEIVALTARQVLLTLFDLATPLYLPLRTYRQSVKKYLRWREIDREKFFERIKYLKRHGYIQTFVEGKEKYLELTAKGKNFANKLLIKNVNIDRPKKWDGKWRIVIFDVPEDKHNARDFFREKLLDIGFLQVQKSVYIYPFECTEIISFLSKNLFIEKYVSILISEIIQGEEKILHQFIENKLLNRNDLKNNQE